jgi:hypothetical protein
MLSPRIVRNEEKPTFHLVWHSLASGSVVNLQRHGDRDNHKYRERETQRHRKTEREAQRETLAAIPR